MITTPVVRLEDVTRIFHKGVGVMHVDLAVEKGTCLALLGPNGAGKTTTLRLVMGMLRPDAGTVRVFDQDPRARPVAVKRRIGYVSEDQPLPLELRPCDLFALFETLYPTWDRERVDAYVDMLELPTDRPLARMSHGQRRQVALVSAIVHRPELLVLDEPAGGLDPLMRRTFLESVIEILAREGTTVLLSSHLLDQVERLADRVAFLDRGRIVLEEDATHLRERAVQVLVEAVDAQAARALPGVLAVRPAEDRTAITMLAAPDEAEALLTERLGARILQTRALGLEDLFVDLLRRRKR